MSKIVNFFKTTNRAILWIVLVIMIVLGGYFLYTRGDNGGIETIVIQPDDFVQTVAVAGKVTPAKSVELGFNRGGKVASVPVVVGQSVVAGQTIASLDAQDAYLALETAKINLKKMQENGTLVNINGLSKDEENSLSVVDKTYLSMSTMFDGLDLILNNYQVSTYKNDLLSETARNYLKVAQTSYGKANDSYESSLAIYRNLKRPLQKGEINKLIDDTYNLTQSLSQAVNDSYDFVSFVYNQTDSSQRSGNLVADRSSLSTWRETVSDNLSALSLSRNTLKDTSLDIASQKLIVEQKQHDYADYFLSAPFAGVITRLDIKAGEQATAGQASVSMINSGLFQIESFVPETSIANLAIGNPAEVTLDAYGTNNLFVAQVIEIDPAETVHDGVSTYKIKLQFKVEDPRIKSGMTANLLITSLKKEKVISVPLGSIINREGRKYVKIMANDQIIEREVVTGITGLLGKTEIISGLKAGEQLIINPSPK